MSTVDDEDCFQAKGEVVTDPTRTAPNKRLQQTPDPPSVL